MRNNEKRQCLLLIGGRSGVGKTTVAAEVSTQLQALGLAHCHVEGDNLDAAYPRSPDDPHGTRLTEANLAALWHNYQAIGHHRLLYVNTASVLEPVMLAGAISPMRPDAHDGDPGAGVEISAVELTATDESVAARLAAREVGGALAEHLSRSRHMAGVLAQQAPAGTVRIGTDGRDVVDIAADVIAASGWSGRER